MRQTKRILLLLCVLAAAHSAIAEEILVAAAADLNQVLPAIAQSFEHESGNVVKLSFGSSGNFFAQVPEWGSIRYFFSADVDFPKRLESARSRNAGPFTVRHGQVVLGVPNGSAFKDINRGSPSLADPLRAQGCDGREPAHAPYGKAALAALRHERIYETIKEEDCSGKNPSPKLSSSGAQR